MEQESLTAKNYKTIKVAAVQAEQDFLNLNGCVAKTCELIEEAGKQGCDLIVFPECFIPGYPDWNEFCSAGAESCIDFGKRLFLNSLSVEDEGMKQIQEVCRKAGVNAVLGINETLPNTRGSMFNTQVYITRDGEIAGKHQKYRPTVYERLNQTDGKTGYINSFETDFGTVSSLICGENSNPLGIYAAGTSYSVVHAASWPRHFGPLLDMHHVIDVASSAIAYTLKTYVVNSVLRISEDYINEVATCDDDRAYLMSERNRMKGATIKNPIGETIASGDGDESELLVAELDLGNTIWPRIFQDTACNYNRPELFAPLFAQYL